MKMSHNEHLYEFDDYNSEEFDKEEIIEKWKPALDKRDGDFDREELSLICEELENYMKDNNFIDWRIFSIMIKLYIHENVKDYIEVYKKFRIWEKIVLSKQKLVETVHFSIDNYIIEEFTKYYIEKYGK